ncbi:MAG: FAD-binding oxidoreductase [Planctomycetota bacterium]
MPRVAQLRRRLIEASKLGHRLVPVGRGTRGLRVASGASAPTSPLATDSLATIDAIDEAELILTCEAGVALATLEAELAPRGLVLPPLFPRALLESLGFPGVGAGTLGGLYSDPRELPNASAWGRLRDQVLGVEALRGDGTFFKAGGRVVKNVTGYDLTRFLCGARGRAALTTRLHLRLERCPESVRCLRLATTIDARFWTALAALRAEASEPPLLAVEPGEPGSLLLADWGPRELVDARLERCGRSLAAALHRSSMDVHLGAFDATTISTRAFDTTESYALRIGAPFSRWATGLAATLASARLEWQWIFPFAHFALARFRFDGERASVRARLDALSHLLRANGGALAFERLPSPDESNEWPDRLEITTAPIAAPLARITQRLMATWDPAGVLWHNTHETTEMVAR